MQNWQKKVPIKDLVIETSNERMPSKLNIDECMKSMCQVFITNADGVKAQQSGVLIGSKVVVTSLHAFEQKKWEGGKKPEVQYSTVRFAEYDETDFEVVQIEPQDIADDLWQSYDVCPTHIDFMILKLKDAPVAVSNGKVAIAKVAWRWGLDEYINKESMPVSTKSFILHYGVDDEKNWHNNVANRTWCISFASNTEDQTWSPEYYKPWLSINVPPTIKKYEQSPWKYGWRVDYGSSGGGVFNDEGELIAIVRGFQQYTNIMSAVPIDYVADNKYGSSTAKSLFNSDGLQTIPGYYFDEIFQIWPYSYTNTPDNNTIPPVHNQPGREIYLSSSSDAFPATQLLPSGSQMGKYELSIYALASTIDVFTYLNSYSSDVFGTLSLTGTENKFSGKSTITGQDLVKDENGNERFNVNFTQNSQGNVFATKVTFNLEIRNVNDCKVSINGASVLDNSKINSISIHGLELKYTGAINDGFKVIGSSGSGSTGIYANNVVALHGSYAPAVYLLANDGCTYNLSGQCVDCNEGCPEFETVFRDIRNVGFLGKLHSNADDDYTIEWDDGTTTAKSVADYQYLSRGKINEHQYKRAGEYSVKVKWREWSFLWLGKHDESKTLASIVVPPLEAEERITQNSYATYRGYRLQYPPVGLVKIRISTLGLYVDRTEVTQGEYARITEKHPFSNFGKYTANYPAENITFYDAIIFCNQKSTEEGYDLVYSYDNPVYSQGNANCISLSNLTADYTKNGYRIPTQQEWTETYFANSENTTTYWAPRNASEYAWYTENSNQKSQPVGHKTPNGANLFDMAGNVSEFIWNGIDSDGKPIGARAGGNFRSTIDGLNGSSNFLNVD